MIDGSVAEHLKVLSLPLVFCVLVFKRVSHADALDRLLLDTVDLLWLLKAADLQNRWDDVDDVVKLRSTFALRSNALWPMNDHRVSRAAEVRGDLLGPLEGGVHRPSPAYRDVRFAGRPADFIEPVDGALQSELDSKQAGHFAERSLQPTFGTRPVVSNDVEHQGVVEFA